MDHFVCFLAAGVGIRHVNDNDPGDRTFITPWIQKRQQLGSLHVAWMHLTTRSQQVLQVDNEICWTRDKSRDGSQGSRS